LAAAATKPRPNPLLNVVALLGGTYLAVRGATGRCPVKRVLIGSPETEPVIPEVRAKRSRRVARR
jgi:hypothetical protein